MRLILLSSIVVTLALAASPLHAQPPVPPAPAGYAWAASCRPCHESIYAAWARSKHASALDRLSGSEQEQGCVACHVTGAPAPIRSGGKVLNAGVQCEACHGAAAAHVADPAVRTGLVKVPPEATCTACHSDKSPHFKGFWYDAMKTVVHHVG